MRETVWRVKRPASRRSKYFLCSYAILAKRNTHSSSFSCSLSDASAAFACLESNLFIRSLKSTVLAHFLLNQFLKLAKIHSFGTNDTASDSLGGLSSTFSLASSKVCFWWGFPFSNRLYRAILVFFVQEGGNKTNLYLRKSSTALSTFSCSCSTNLLNIRCRDSSSQLRRRAPRTWKPDKG